MVTLNSSTGAVSYTHLDVYKRQVILLIVSYLIIQKDLREKQKTSKMLEETIEQNAALLQMRNKIILTISHDIRSPLNVISATVELARREVDNQRRDTYLSNIESVCLHVVHLLNNLLDVYRLNQSKEECNYVPFSLHEMLDRIASRFSGLVNDKGLLFNTSFDNTDVRLRGDVDRIEQIVGNLLSNAIKFTECGEISFHAGYSQGKLYLEVTDSGIGMTEETLARIFRPFERQMTANNTDGFGLGLSIIQGLVHLFNGEIDVKSKIHQGSTFKVTLPLEETDEPLECEKPVLTHTGHLPHNILVIDDDSMLRAVIKDLLERKDVYKRQRGGKSIPISANRFDMYKYALTTRDRIVTKTDILNFCRKELGKHLQNIRIEHGTMVSSRPHEGLVRSIDIYLTLKKDEERDLDFMVEDLENRLSSRSLDLSLIHIF